MEESSRYTKHSLEQRDHIRFTSEDDGELQDEWQTSDQFVFGLDFAFAWLDLTMTNPTKTSTKDTSATRAIPGMIIAYSRAGK